MPDGQSYLERNLGFLGPPLQSAVDVFGSPAAGPSATTPGGLSVPSYEELIGMTGITDQAKAAIIQTYYPGRFRDWLLDGGGGYYSRGQIVAPGLVQLPDGAYFAIDEGRIVPQDYAQSLIDQARGVSPSNLPPGATQVSPNYYQLQDGSYVNTNGDPASLELVTADQQAAGIGGGGEVANQWEYTDPETGEIFIVSSDRFGAEISRVSTGRFGQIGGAGALTPYQQSTLDFQQQQLAWQQSQFGQSFGLQQQQFAAQQAQAQVELERQQANYMADLRANPASWLEYAYAQGETPTIQPWMWGLMPEEMRQGAAIGQPIPGATAPPQTSGFPSSLPLSDTGLPQLTTPSPQYLARTGPTGQAQYLGYEQARTGSPLDQTQWALWSQAPPGGGSVNLAQRR